MSREEGSGIDLGIVSEHQTGAPVLQCRAMPVSLGPGSPEAFLAAYSSVFDNDPYVEMFFFPEDNLHLSLLTGDGRAIWHKDLGPGVMPGVWFCPVLAFDLDGDGIDELWFVNNLDPRHPLGVSNYVLERLDPRDGRTTGQWPWPNLGGNNQSLSHQFRNFILGAYVRGKPVLVTAQGTYGDMFLQGWGKDMVPRWSRTIAKDEEGARGSHMVPVVDLNGDGVDELLWGERCIELDTGTELFCCDRDSYGGHSDVIQPTLDRRTGRWFVYVCRETEPTASPRVALYDDRGNRIWGDVEAGHMDMGLIARWNEAGDCLATSVRIGKKTCGPDGRFHDGWDEFAYDAFSGAPRKLPFSVYKMIPVDLDGDGLHEFVQGAPGGGGAVFGRDGKAWGTIGGSVAIAGKILDRPGEQLLSYHADGAIRIWADKNAADSPAALERYANPFYRSCLRLQGNGYNYGLLGGL